MEHKASRFKQKETPPYTCSMGTSLCSNRLLRAAFVLPSATLQLAFSGRLAQLMSNDFSFSSAHLQELGLLPQAARLSSTSCPENTFKIVPQSLGTCT